jgi:hypothetical protein
MQMGTSKLPPRQTWKRHFMKNRIDVRSLTDAELNEVSGGSPALAVVVGAIAIGWFFGMSGPNVGTIERQAEVLGLNHLL